MMDRRAWGSGRTLLAAAFLGALMAVALIPGARSTVEAQWELALGRRPEWMRAASGESASRLKQALAADPGDVDLQVGAATLLPSRLEAGGIAGASPGLVSRPNGAVILQRLNRLAKQSPNNAAVRAHQLRYLAQDAVRIGRWEESEVTGLPCPRASSGPPAPQAVRAFSAAAAAGVELEPDNGFFDAMQAVSEFAAGRDQEALRDLHSAVAKPRWDDHAADETRSQWKLLQAAYGDHGVLQELPASRSLMLPQFAQISAAAQRAVWNAAQRERAGDLAGAIAIRHDVIQLGIKMAEAPPPVIGKWFSLQLVDIGGSPVPPDPPLSYAPPMNPQTVQKLIQERRERYERFLRAHGQAEEADWVHEQRARADTLLEQTNQLYGPGTGYPPGLLVTWWVFDLMLLRQAAVLLLLWGCAALLRRVRPRTTDESGPRAILKWALASLAVFLTPVGMSAAVGALRITGGSLDMNPIFRLIASAFVLWSGALLLARLGGGEAGLARSARILYWLSASLGLLAMPFVLVAIAGPDMGLWGTVGISVMMAGLLGLSRRSGRRAHQAERPPHWQPGLVALTCVLPSTLLLFSGLVFSSSYSEDALGVIREYSLPVVLLVLVPSLLVIFAALCRVAALDLPLRAGLVRVVRQIVPHAAALLALIYIAALVPTLAGDRASQQTLDRVFAPGVSGSTPLR